MTNEQAQQLAEAVIAVDYGELVKSLLNRVGAREMTLEAVLRELAQKKAS